MEQLELFIPFLTRVVSTAIFYLSITNLNSMLWVIISTCLIIGIYRLHFHPLSRYPGPLFARLSGLYGAYHASKTTLHIQTLRDHQKFGSVIRQGPNKLLFSSVNALDDIYKNERITKSCAYLVSQRAPDTYGLFNSVDRQMHQRKRKLLGPILSDRATRTFEATMIDQIDIFLKGLSSSCQGPSISVNMTERLNYLAMDITGQFVFGYPLNLQTDKTYRFMTDTTPNYFLNIALQLPFLSKARISNFRHLRAFIRGNSYRHMLQEMIRSRLGEGNDSKHNLLFMTDTLRVSDDDETFIEEIRSEATFFLSAGSDTMSTCLGALFFYLSGNPKCYQRLSREIRSGFTSSAEIKAGPHLRACVYLRACIDEALRMSPPVPGTLWRQQVSKNDKEQDPLVIDGHVIPHGTHIGVNTYALQHNETYFPEPFTFRPERFLEENDTIAGMLGKRAFAPFSLGARGCMGKNMAYLEASLVLAKTLWHFDFERAPGDEGRVGESTCWKGRGGADAVNEYQMGDIFGATHDGPCLIFKSRN